MGPLLLISAAVAAPSAAVPRAITVDDVLAMEDLGNAVVGLDDTLVVYERMPTYANAPNLPAIFDLLDRRATARLYAARVGGEPNALPLFEQDARAGYWIGALSPHGARLAIYRLLEGVLSAGVVDLRTKRVLWLDFTPNFFWYHQKPVWISEEELLFPALSTDRHPSFIYRPSLTSRLTGLWKQAFDGREASATVLESPSNTGPPAPYRGGALLRVHALTGQAPPIAQGYFYNLRLSPSGRYLAALKEGQAVQPDPATPFLGFRDRVQRSLIVLDLETGQALTPCADCHVALGTLDWVSDADELSFFAAHDGTRLEQGQWRRYQPADRILAVLHAHGIVASCRPGDLRSGRIWPFAGGVLLYGRAREADDSPPGGPCSETSGKGRDDWFAGDPNGEFVNLTRRFGSVSSDLVALTRNAAFLIGDGRLWRIDSDYKLVAVAGTRTEPVAVPSGSIEPRDDERHYLGMPMARARPPLRIGKYYAPLDPVRSRIGRRHLGPAAGASLLFVSASGRTSIFRYADRHSLELTAVREGAQVQIAGVGEQLRDVIPGATRSLSYMLRGADATLCALLPPGLKVHERAPAVVFIYPRLRGRCPQSETSLASFRPYNMQLMAARGYAVVFPFLDDSSAAPANRAAYLTEAVIAAVDAAGSAGLIDAGRVGLYGGSQGQYPVLQILTQTTRFRAAVVAYGITDPVSQYGAMPLNLRMSGDAVGAVGDWARFEARQSPDVLHASPWEDPSAYAAASIIFRADRIRTPLLLFHSDLDQFPLSQSEQLFSALYRLGREATYVTYWGEGHFAWSPANIRDFWQRVFDWYERHLTGDLPR